jgi:hypothetical protein
MYVKKASFSPSEQSGFAFGLPLASWLSRIGHMADDMQDSHNELVFLGYVVQIAKIVTRINYY